MFTSVAGITPGRIQAGKYDTIMAPSLIGDSTRNPVIYCHGAGGDGQEATGSTGLPSVKALLREFVKHEHVVASPSQTHTYGNGPSDIAIAAAITHLRANGFNAQGDAILVGASHGAACALRYAFLHPNDVAAVLITIPLLDLQYARDQNLLGIRPNIDAAWNVTYPAPLPANANPATISVIPPVLAWYASNDNVSTNIASWDALQTDATVVNVGALGHTDATIAAHPPATAVQWVQDRL